MRHYSGRVWLLILGGVVLRSGSAAAQRPAPRRPAGPVASPVEAQGQYKGIWEPVNYSEDINLNSVYFVTADEGWVTGGGMSHGVLLHTVDGGSHWTVALGDPAGDGRAFTDLRFVDRATGFAVQGSSAGEASGNYSLLRTRDGDHWEVSGTVPKHKEDYRFVSATTGVVAIGGEIRRTTDGGRTWRTVFDCALKIEVAGLSKMTQCEVDAFAFPTATVGYAVGSNVYVEGLYILRTDDAGATWSVWFNVTDSSERDTHIFFTDELSGYICTNSGKFLGTADGGKTWAGLAGADCEGRAPVLFADAEVGWTLRYSKLTYTTDGGHRWSSRTVTLPASIYAFSLPRRDRAYAVGDHGMVYRYRVVPVATTVANAVAAPVMPGIPTTLATDVVQLQGQVATIDSGLTAFVDPGAGAGAGSGAPTPAMAGGFAQDAASPFVANCCGKRLSGLELVLKAVGGIVPGFIAKYKNLNLLAQGLRMASNLPEMADSLKTALKGFREAPDRASAVQALAGVKSLLDGFKAQVDTALQKKPEP